MGKEREKIVGGTTHQCLIGIAHEEPSGNALRGTRDALLGSMGDDLAEWGTETGWIVSLSNAMRIRGIFPDSRDGNGLHRTCTNARERECVYGHNTEITPLTVPFGMLDNHW